MRDICGAVKGINRNTFWMWIWIRKHFFKSIFLILFCLVTLIFVVPPLCACRELRVESQAHYDLCFYYCFRWHVPKAQRRTTAGGLTPPLTTDACQSDTVDQSNDGCRHKSQKHLHQKGKKTISKDMAQEFVWVLFIGGQCHIKCLTILGGFKQPQELQVCGQFKRKMDKKNRDINRCTRVKKTKTHNKHTYRMIFLV